MADKIIKICDRCGSKYSIDKNTILSFENKELNFKIDLCPSCAGDLGNWAINSELYNKVCSFRGKEFIVKIGDIHNMKEFCKEIGTEFYLSNYIGLGDKVYFGSREYVSKNSKIIMERIYRYSYEVVEIKGGNNEK